MTNNTNEIIGLQGITGAQGFQGAQGNIGAQGQRGIQGAQGRIGMNGAQGVQGLRGEHGMGGFIGLQGAQGTQGIQGHRGPRGYMGCIGKPGEVGIQGLQGAKGHIWVDGISLDGYNTHLFTLVNNKFQSVDGSLLTLNNGAKISLWLDENCYNYLINNECRITVDDNVYTTDKGKEKLISTEKTAPVYYANSKLLTEIINSNNDLNTVVELVYYNESWYYAGGLIGLNSGESVSYTAGDGISIENNEIKVKIADDDSNALQVNENGELFVSQSEKPESVEYTAGNSIEISDDNKINVIVSESENNILTFDENGKLLVPQQENPESVEYEAGQGVEISDDNKINVKISTSEDNALGLNESGELFVPQVEIPETIEYTAGEGIDINENNKISVKLNDIVSESENNILTIDENGKLSVPQVEIPEQYNVISSDSEEDFVRVDVTKNDESKQFELKTDINIVSSLFELTDDDVDGLVTAKDVKDYIKWYVLEQFKKTHPDAEVYYDETDDTMVINKEGTIGPDDLEEIEKYIDNANMGTY